MPEEYLKAKEEQEQQERLQEAERARRKKQQQEEEQQQHEAEKLDRLYETLSSEQRADIDRETEARIPPFIQEQIARQRKQGEELSVATTAIIESNRHEVLRTRLQDGRLEAYND